MPGMVKLRSQAEWPLRGLSEAGITSRNEHMACEVVAFWLLDASDNGLQQHLGPSLQNMEVLSERLQTMHHDMARKCYTVRHYLACAQWACASAMKSCSWLPDPSDDALQQHCVPSRGA